MIPQLGSRDHRALWLGVVLLVPPLLWTYALAPALRALTEARDRVVAERELLRRELALLERVERDPAALELGLQRLAAVQPRLLGSGDRASLTALLTVHVQLLAEERDVLVTRVDAVEVAAPGALVPVGIRVSGESDFAALLALLHALEGGPHVVHVDNLRIGASTRAPAPAYGAGYLTPDAAAVEVLSFELVVTGFGAPATGVPAARSTGEGDAP